MENEKKQFSIEDLAKALSDESADVQNNDQLKQNPMMDSGMVAGERLESVNTCEGSTLKKDSFVSYNPVAETKGFRGNLDFHLQRIKDSPRKSRERSIAITKLQEAIMWLGMDLKDQGTPNPYPQSYNPNSPDIEPTADNLKL